MAGLLKLFCMVWLVVSVRSVCDQGWQQNGLFCYYFSDQKSTFTEADEFCVRVAAELLDITDFGENTYCYTQSAAVTDESYWIGYQKISQNIWRWKATDVAGSYVRWDIGEPDEEGSCARLTPYEGGSWRDANCDRKLRFICKKQADCGEAPSMQDKATVAYSTSAIASTSGTLFYSSGTLAYYMCEEGHDYDDGSLTKSSMCELDGDWVPDLPTFDPCKPKKCHPPPTFDFMTMNVSLTQSLYDFGTVVSYSCEFGYWFSSYEYDVEKKILRCENKEWRGDSIKHCSRMFCFRPVTENSRANTSSNERGTAAYYKCNTGFRFADNSTAKVFVCGSQTWVPPAEPCLAKKCPPFPWIDGAINSTADHIYDTTLVWTCKRGKMFPDTTTYKTMYCQENEKWTNVVTIGCSNKVCTSAPTNGTDTHSHNWNSSTTYAYLKTVTYTCKQDGWTFPGKEPSSTRVATCGEDGEWIPKNLGECTGDRVVVETSREPIPATESENAVVAGIVGIIVMVVLTILIIILDVTTIGKHIAVMKANLCPAKKEKEDLLKEKLQSWKGKASDEGKSKRKTVIKGKEKDKPRNKMMDYHIESEASPGGSGTNAAEKGDGKLLVPV